VRFTQLDKGRTAGELFKTTLEKALFSSPAACLATITNRIKRLTKTEEPAYAEDIHALEDLARDIERIAPQDFSKYQKLLSVICDPQLGFGWTGKDTHDRLVIFTERIETLNFLAANLPHDLGLKKEQVEILHGTLPDVDQNKLVEDFGREEAPVRLLIASDVAAEGINLHFLSHRMIHFDIPWSLMIFQQRNGRIDRYGQEQTPQIAYLVTESQNAKIRGDTRILELLVQKDEQAVKNIGDPSALMGVYDIEEEEKITARAIEQGQSAEDFEALLEKPAFDPLTLIMGAEAPPIGKGIEDRKRTMPSLFRDDFTYLRCDAAHSSNRTAAGGVLPGGTTGHLHRP
jgi:superfamily II DNA/RNA helicase